MDEAWGGGPEDATLTVAVLDTPAPDWGGALGPAGTFSHLVSLMAMHGIGHSSGL